MKAKHWILLISAIFAVASVGVGSVYSKKKAEQIIHGDLSQYKKKSSNKPHGEQIGQVDSDIEEKINKLFLNDEKVYLAQGLSVDQIANIRSSIERLPDSEEKEKSEKLLNEAGRKLAIQTTLNSFFEHPVLNGDTVSESLVVKQTVTEDQINDLKNTVNEQSNGDGFYEKVNQILSQIHPSGVKTETTTTDSAGHIATPEDVQYAQALIDEIIVDGNVRSDFTMAQYENANAAVKALPEGAEKTELMQEIKKIQEAMTNMGISYTE